MTEEQVAFLKNLLNLFTLEGKKVGEIATPGQVEIFGAIVMRSPRTHIITPTQYGKSLFVALACLYLSCVEGEIVSIVAPNEDKARIIMRYYIQHVADHPLFFEQLDKDTKVDKLQMERTKDRITLKNGGGIYLLSVQAGNARKGFEAAMGAGSKIVIMDEAAIIPDVNEATVFRMIAGKGASSSYTKIGNPFYKNHFYRSSIDSRYKHIFIDYHQGLKEGRYTEDFIEEARGKPLFSVLYECKFPDDSHVDADGYQRLLTDSQVSFLERPSHFGVKVLGVDPAGGGDDTAIVLKSDTCQEVLFCQQFNDTMQLVPIIGEFHKKYGTKSIVVDATGIGAGLSSRLKELGFPVTAVNFGERPDGGDYANRKAELYWKQREWMLKGGRLAAHPRFEDFYNIKYRVSSGGDIQIQGKDDLREKGLPSPDAVEAAVLTMAAKINKFRYQPRPFYDNVAATWRK